MVINGLDAAKIVQYQMIKNLLILDNVVTREGSNINFSAANEWYATNRRGTSAPEDWKHSGNIFIVENHINMRNNPTGPLNGIAGLAHHVAIIGNISEEAKEHSIRLFGTYKSVIGHNIIMGPATDSLRHDIKVMANGTNSWPSSNEIFHPGTTTKILPNTRFVRVHNNTVGSENSVSYWHIQFSPQDDGSSGTVEGLRDIIVENNDFVDGEADDGLERGVQVMGRNIVIRNNNYPSSWASPVQTTMYPSNYSSYSQLYSEFWHGPDFVGETSPDSNAPDRAGLVCAP